MQKGIVVTIYSLLRRHNLQNLEVGSIKFSDAKTFASNFNFNTAMSRQGVKNQMYNFLKLEQNVASKLAEELSRKWNFEPAVVHRSLGNDTAFFWAKVSCSPCPSCRLHS